MVDHITSGLHLRTKMMVPSTNIKIEAKEKAHNRTRSRTPRRRRLSRAKVSGLSWIRTDKLWRRIPRPSISRHMSKIKTCKFKNKSIIMINDSRMSIKNVPQMTMKEMLTLMPRKTGWLMKDLSNHMAFPTKFGHTKPQVDHQGTPMLEISRNIEKI